MNDKRENSGPPPADAMAPAAGSTASPQAGSHSTGSVLAGPALRTRAEELAPTMSPTTLSTQTPEEIQRVFHELQVHQIELEMQNEELRAAQAQIEAGRARYFDLYDMAPVGYCTLSEKGLILEANLTAATLLGTARGALVKQPLSRFILTEDQDIYYLHRKQLFETGAPQEHDLRLVKPDGALFWAHLTATAAQAEDGAPVYLMVLSDITARKRAEETLANERRLLRTLIDNLPVAVYIKDIHGRKTIVNRTDLDNIGLPESEVLGKTDAELFPAEIAARFEADDQTVLNSGTPVYDREELLTNRDGKTFWQLTSKVPLCDADGQIAGLVGIGRDITERKRDEEALRQNEEKFSVMFRKAPYSAALSSISDFKLMEVNEQFEKLWGYSAAEAVGKTSDELGLYPNINERARLRAIFREKGFIHDVETKMEAKTGELKDVLINSDIVKIGNEQFVLSTVQNITERKQLEIERQKFFMLAESSSEFIGMCDLEMNPLYVNPAGRRMVGLPDMEAACRVKVQDYYFPEDQQFIAEEFFPRVLREGHGDVEIRLRHFQTGEPIWVYYYLFSIQDASGTPIGWATVSLDITARKRMEETLRASEEQHRRLFETMSPGVIYQAADGTIISANPAAERVVGLTSDQMRGKTSMDPRWKMVLEDGTPVPGTEHPAMLALRTGEKVGPVIRGVYIPEKDAYVWLSITATPLFRPGEDQPFQAYATFDDITARKQAEAALRESEEKFRSLFNQSTEGIYLHDLDGHILDVNIMACAQSGYSREEWLGLTVFDSHPHESTTNLLKDEILQAWRQRERGQRWLVEAEHQHKDGTVYPVEISTGMIRYGDANAIMAIVKDITERKQAEAEREAMLEALRESEQRYRGLFEQMTEGFALHEIIIDAQGVPCDYRFLEINPAFEQLTSLTRERCVGKTVLDVLPNIDPHWIADYGQVALTGEPKYLEDYVPALERYYEVWAYSPQPRQFATLVKDVTERRQQEIERAALLEAEHEQRLRAETLSDVTLALASALDSSDVLMEILRQAQRLVPSDASNIALVEDDTAERGAALRIVGWRGYAKYGGEQELAGMRQPLADFPINTELVASGQPYIASDTYDDQRWQRTPATAWVRAHISLPIRLGESVLGVLRLDSEQAQAFSAQDVERLLPLARAAAIALENAQLYTQAQQELAERQRSQAALEASERKFREMLENVRLFAVMLDMEGRVTFCNDFGLALLGKERPEVVGGDWFETFIPPTLRATMRSAFAANFHTGDFPAHYENEIITAGGAGRALLAWNNMVIRDAAGDIISVAAVGEDITARRQAERALEASEAWLRSFVDSMDDIIFSLDAEQRHTALYGRWVERMGVSPEYFLGRTARDVFGPDEAARVHETANRRVLETGVSVTYEWTINDYQFQTTLSPLRGPEGEIVGLVGVGRDITALKDYQAQLQTALDEKTLMLSEIHHRIKNNLQVILGLLELQFGAVEDEGTQQMLRESQNRIKAIALIHERLYQTPGESQIDAGLYFQSLVRYLTQTYDAQVRGIVVEQSIADLPLDIDLAIPCALIVNELITNALKYAFPPGWQPPGDAPPTLRVALYCTNNHVRLEVADNGVGLPEDMALETSPRLGLRLIKMLARQIDGELRIERDKGTCIAVTFVLNEEK